MKVLITAGGTTEKIDSVRSISNISTGKLGSLIAGAFSNLHIIDEIIYVCSSTAMLPQSNKVKVIYVNDVSSLESAIKNLLNQHNIDIIVHSMAVSDYRVKSVTTASKLADSLILKQDILSYLSEKNAKSIVYDLLSDSKTIIDSSGKISSDIDNMILLMERTPKIIALFQNLYPNAILVGFKLMDNVTQETLIDTAYSVLRENKCNFVLANDLSDINENIHIGYLLDNDKKYNRFTTKEEIAKAIVEATTNIRRE